MTMVDETFTANEAISMVVPNDDIEPTLVNNEIPKSLMELSTELINDLSNTIGLLGKRIVELENAQEEILREREAMISELNALRERDTLRPCSSTPDWERMIDE